MNKQESDILQSLLLKPFINQRILAESSGHSLGIVSRSIHSLIKQGYLNNHIQPTELAVQKYKNLAPKNAIILAAGYGMRMAPISIEISKAMLEIDGEPLIERQIRQLHEAGVNDIIIVTGFLKEKFEYLIDKFDVKLVVNTEYARKNNLHSLALAADKISNTYIIPCDIWCKYNPFNSFEMYSWYMVSDKKVNDSDVLVNRKKELVKVSKCMKGNAMIGITYLLEEDAVFLREKLKSFDLDDRHTDDFWEIVLYSSKKMMISARVVQAESIAEINTYEQLRELDGESDSLKSEVIDIITDTFQIEKKDISGISVLKKGMTNRSFLFSINHTNRREKYIMRIPGEGTQQLINRTQEAQVLETVAQKGLCDRPVYVQPENGYKITRFIEGVRTADVSDVSDLHKCMTMLRDFHEMNLKARHAFDMFKKINFYESLWKGRPSIYKDYKQTKENVESLKQFIRNVKKDWCLCHIDAVPDNFLFYTENGQEKLQLTDWEYAGMQDPHVDVAMFCIYSLYEKWEIDRLIRIYFDVAGMCCDDITRAKIYAYISCCGLLWSNWCEYKSGLGIEFGEYSLRQYRFAKDYYRYATEELQKLGIGIA